MFEKSACENTQQTQEKASLEKQASSRSSQEIKKQLEVRR